MAHKKSKLSVIIPACNEGEEVRRTVESIKEDVEIIVVDDFSTPTAHDREGWRDISDLSVKVIHNKLPLGFGGSIQAGIDAAHGDNIWICGARTRFPDKFLETVTGSLKERPETIFSVQSEILRYDKAEPEGIYYGANIQYHNKEQKIFGWLRNYGVRQERLGEVPCAYGGSYILRKDFWTKLHGLSGIDHRGGCNQFLSLKAWTMGDGVRMIPLLVGNIYRDRCSYPVNTASVLYNRVMIMTLMFGYAKGLECLNSYKGKYYEQVRLAYAYRSGWMAEERAYIMKNRKRKLNGIVEY